LELAKIELAHRDPADLGAYVFEWEPQPCHRQWQQAVTENNRTVIFAPVEHGKSAQLSVARPLWEIGRDPTTSGAIISDSARQAQRFLAVISQTIATNKRYQAVFPHVRPEERKGHAQQWGSEAIIVERDAPDLKDPTVQALGVEGAILGARLKWAVLDDVLNFSNTLTPDAREKTLSWYQSTLTGRMLEDSWVLWIQTPWDKDDAPHRLANERGYASFSFDAEENLWPARWTKERLEERRKELGEFEYLRQLRCQVAEDARRVFQREWLGRARAIAQSEGLRLLRAFPPSGSGALRHGERVGLGVDLAVQKGRENDLSAIVAEAFDVSSKTRRILWVEAGQWEFGEIIARVRDLGASLRAEVAVVEDNAAQAYVVQHLRDMGGLYVVGHTTGTQKWSPDIGVQSMAVDFEAGRWRLPEGDEVDALIREAADFRPGQHTGDRLMALWLIDKHFSREAGSASTRRKPLGL